MWQIASCAAAWMDQARLFVRSAIANPSESAQKCRPPCEKLYIQNPRKFGGGGIVLRFHSRDSHGGGAYPYSCLEHIGAVSGYA